MLTPKQTFKTANLMRVNHSGEVCAQALYRGQAIFASNNANKAKLLQAAQEEEAHLDWCSKRLQELGGKPSIFNPVWYAGAFAIGTIASFFGDEFSFGFLAETELQVGEHLAENLTRVEPSDQKTRSILQQMHKDELKHANTALNSGGKPLPLAIKLLMRTAAKVMTTISSKI